VPIDTDTAEVVCVTPVRNEAWILERFLRSAELWADRIVVADQGSSDGSREIAAGFSKVTLLDNHVPAYDEGARQRLLLSGARRIPGRRVIVALDADEILSADFAATPEWAAVRAAPSGTILTFDWINVLPGFTSAWIPPEKVPFGFVDDGSDHRGDRIHSTRIPVRADSPVLQLDDLKVLHLQYTDWSRMKSKQRWYQCWETLEHPTKRPIQIYRQYHRMDGFPAAEIHPLSPRWLSGYERRGIDIRAASEDAVYWWDKEVLDWLARHGAPRFRRLDVWDVDWAEIAARLGRAVAPASVRDPRSAFERAVHRWLEATQRRRPDSRRIRWMQRTLIPLGW
jgi:hypothetical protein